MNAEQVRRIENCFDPHHVVDMSNATPATAEDCAEFEVMLEKYRMQEHVILWTHHYQEIWEREHNGCPF